jgi:hypothetical protein
LEEVENSITLRPKFLLKEVTTVSFKNLRSPVSSLFSVYLLLILPASLSIVALAQKTVSVSGRVTDQTGAALMNATLTVRQPGGSFEQTGHTNAKGEYRFEVLPPANTRLVR